MAIKDQIGQYTALGYTVTELVFDSEGAIKILIEGHEEQIKVPCKIRQANKGDHVPQVERCIRTVKERVRIIGLALDFDIGDLVLKYLISHAVNCINIVPKKGKHVSPYELLHGRRIDFKLFTRARFGQYYLIPLSKVRTNPMEERACGAICLGSAIDCATPGTFHFYTIQTGKLVRRTQCYFQRLNPEVIEKLSKFSQKIHKDFFVKDQGYTLPIDDAYPSDDDMPRHPQVVHPAIADELTGNTSNTPAKRKFDASDATSTQSADVPISGDTSQLSYRDIENCRGVGTGSISHIGPKLRSNLKRPEKSSVKFSSSEPEVIGDPESLPTARGPIGVATNGTGVNEFSSFFSFQVNTSEAAIDMSEDLPEDPSDVLISEPRTADELDPEAVCYKVRAVEDNDLVVSLKKDEKESMTLMTFSHSETSKLKVSPFIVPMALVLITMASQLSVPKSITAWGDKAVDAICAELYQLVDKDVFAPLDYDSLSPEDKKIVLRTLMFVKIKRDGKVKARLCMDGRLQALYIVEDYGSPTVSTESVMATAAIDAHEERVVVCVDIEGAYLAVDMEDDVYGMFDSVVAQFMIRLYPEFAKFMRNGRLYFKLKKALYGCVQSALLFYRHLRRTLEAFGFKVNPYDQCVFTRDFDGKQCTICTHVDDLKISCADPKAVEAVLEELTRVYKKIAIHRGPVLDYLGMELDYSTPGKVKVSMSKSIEATLKEHEVSDGEVKTPASSNLFTIDKNSKSLEKTDREEFHSVVAKLLYIAKHGRPDILLAVSFLTTRVTEPTTQDKEKLDRVLKYLKSTIDLKLTLEIGNMHFVDAYIDASFATHEDMKSQTGTYISLGGGAIFARSAKQKIVCKSSTEAELVGLSESLTPVIWLRNFLEALGYSMEASTVHQDNMSTIALANKGRSTSQRTRHMNIKYFFVKDRISSGEVRIKYTPTESMVADFFTKPLQGILFNKFRNIIMNNVP